MFEAHIACLLKSEFKDMSSLFFLHRHGHRHVKVRFQRRPDKER